MGLDRFGQAGVHSGGQEGVARLGRRIGGEPDDGDLFAAQFLHADQLGRFDPAHARHMHVHQQHVEIVLVERFKRTFAVVRKDHLVPGALESHRNDPLVHRIVFSNQYPEGAEGGRLACFLFPGGFGARRSLLGFPRGLGAGCLASRCEGSAAAARCVSALLLAADAVVGWFKVRQVGLAVVTKGSVDRVVERR